MDDLQIHDYPLLNSPSMVMGLTGWMDAGSVSTGAVAYLADALNAERLADIGPLDFYILNFPVSTIPITVYVEGGKTHVSTVNPMDFAAMFRPATEIRDGVVEDITLPVNAFMAARNPDMILFSGEEPHIRWGSYIDCILRVAEEFDVTDIIFVGSVASPIPHTRPPRVRCSAPSVEQRDSMKGIGSLFTDYAGPCSVITVLGQQALSRGISVRSVVVEVPHYPFLEMPSFPLSIARALASVADLVGIDIDLSDLEADARKTDAALTRIMGENREFRELVEHLETSYDREPTVSDESLLRRLIEGMDVGEDGQIN